MMITETFYGLCHYQTYYYQLILNFLETVRILQKSEVNLQQ